MIEIKIQNNESRSLASMKDQNGNLYKAPIFMDQEDIRGKVFINLYKGKNVEHSSIRIECIGVIEHLMDSSRNLTFLQLWKDVEPPGNLYENSDYDFQFPKCELLHESYNGGIVRVRYYINVVINRSYGKIIKEAEFVV